MLDENRGDTLIASDASLVTDSIIRGESLYAQLTYYMYVAVTDRH